MNFETEVRCPVCRTTFDIEEEFELAVLDIGHTILCPGCDAELEIINDEPYEVSVVEKESYFDDEDSDFEN